MSESKGGSQERTEHPTPRRRDEARREGRVARSPEVAAAVALLAGATALWMSGGSLGRYAEGVLRGSARALAEGPLTTVGATTRLQSVTLGLVLALLPVLLATTALILLAHLVQTRGAFSWKPLAPKWSNLSPVAGLKRIVGPDGPINAIKSAVKLALLAAITAMVLTRGWPELMSLADVSPAGTLTVLGSHALRLLITIGLAFLVVSLADFGWQWLKLERSLRMTRQELIEEHRETEGDPIIKARIRSIARARARQRMLQQVPTADVVVVNPTEVAVALRYDVDDAPAPVVVAMGERKLAQRIRDVARKSNVTIVENRPIARALLATGTVGRMIPPALYAAVAEILAFVYRQRGILPGGLAAPRSEP
jgi:flagellar biosynthetic protein FlhB